MTWKTLSLLMAFSSPAALAGGNVQNAPETAWLGHEVQLQNTSFCKRYGCAQKAVRQNTENNMGWHDGQQVTYRLRGGAELNLDVRVANTPPGQGRWISNARLALPKLGKGANTAELRLAADFYTALTGRPFSVQSVRACLRAAEADPDTEGGNILTSNGTTPPGLPYRARCGHLRPGFPFWPRFWVGWMQQ